MKTLTVITTTYNRAYCLHQVYNSLVEQKCKDFIWLIIDDGSTDGTRELVENWMAEKLVDIEYYYKFNGGMHTARNLGYEKVQTELNVIIDSDDWMAENAVETIINYWNANKRDDIAGIIALNANPNGDVIGTDIPGDLHECHFTEFWEKYKMRGDKKLIYRSSLTRQFPYPEYPGEKFYPPSYKFTMIDQKYSMLVMNEIVCVVDYNDDSMTRDKYAQYRTSPRGFAHYRNEISVVSDSPKKIIREMVHYVAESKFAGDKQYIRHAHRKMYAILSMIPGNMLYLYLKKTRRKY